MRNTQTGMAHPRMVLLLLILLAVTCTAGCLIVPIEPFTKAPYPPALLKSLTGNHADRNAVRSALGKPQAVRSGGRYWFYTSSRPAWGFLAGTGSAVVEDYEWVLVEFDDSGQVVRAEYNDDSSGCLADGICILSGFGDEQPVISAPTEQAAAAIGFRPDTGTCAIYLYLDKQPWFSRFRTTACSIDGQLFGRVSDAGFLFLTHPAGTVRVSAGQTGIHLPCPGGSRVYLQAVPQPARTQQPAVDLAPVSERQGEAAIRQRRMLLPD